MIERDQTLTVLEVLNGVTCNLISLLEWSRTEEIKLNETVLDTDRTNHRMMLVVKPKDLYPVTQLFL